MVNKLKAFLISFKIYLLNLCFDTFSKYRKKKQKEFRESLSDSVSTTGTTEDWIQNQKDLISELRQGRLSEFLQFETIRRTMYYEAKLSQFIELSNSENWNFIKNGIKENIYGQPKPYKYYPLSGGNLIHHAYSLMQLIEVVGLNRFLEISSVFEFGGGYGSFRRLVANLGLNGKYVIFDIPLFSNLQKLYLDMVLKNHSTIFKDEVDQGKTDKNDLFVALWSLSETPLSFRKKFEQILKTSKLILIAFQSEFQGIDNKSYFENLIQNKVIVRGLIKPVKASNNNYYLIGTNDNSRN